MRRLFLLLVLFTCSAPLTFAQGGDGYHKVEVFGGYSRGRAETKLGDADPDFFEDFTDGRTGFNGFDASVTRNVSRYVGLKFDLSGHYNTRGVRFGNGGPTEVESSLHNFLGGVQLKNNSKGAAFKPFAHALVGAARGRHEVVVVCIQAVGAPCAADADGSDIGLAGAFGGGVDIRAGRRLDLRAFQVDYNPARLFGATQHNVRFGVGVVIH